MILKERNQLDEQLKKLALEAQQHLKEHSERKTLLRITLTELITAIWQSGKLCRPYKGQFKLLYEDIYDEAVQNLYIYICTNIHDYNPQRGEVMTWVNMLLTKRFFPEAIPKLIGTERDIHLEQHYLENLGASETVDAFEKIRQCIESDPKGLFKNEHTKGKLEVNFQAIAIRRYSGISWKDISAEWSISISTLSSFYQRCLKKFAPEIREYL